MALQPPDSSGHPPKWRSGNPWKDVKPTVGAFPSSPQPESDFELLGQQSLTSAVKERRHDYIRKRNIKIKVGTWNVAAIHTTYKDLAAWFLQGLGVKGLRQDLSGLAASDISDDSDDGHIESVEDQERRARGKQATVPIGEHAAVPSDDEVGLYVLGLQEVVDISSLTEVMRPYYDPNPGKKWKRAVKRGLPHGYVKIAEQQLLGLLILVFAAPDVAPQITSVNCTSVGTGALGYAGNKGAVSVRMVLGGTTRLLFVNSHLAAGADQSALARRIWDTNQILARTKFEPSLLDGELNPVGQESIGDEDFAFWFGDLNYRLDDIPGEDVRRLLLLHTRNEYDVLNKSKMKIDSELGYINAPAGSNLSIPDESERRPSDGKPAKESSAEPALDPKDDPASLITTINSLLQHDQLRAQMKAQKAFHDGWREGEINFLPTYKYDVGSVGMFDSGEKKRSPSWCDRILYRTRKDVLDYKERVKQGAEARKRDEQMKAQGIDQDAAEQEVLFDYDPDTDAADDYDEYDEAEDHQDSQSILIPEGLEDTITLENYISHQRVLSSDHKPLSAVFSLTYDAVVSDLKAQVQHEVVRMMDKNENETRPNITLVVDNPPEGTANTDRPTGSSELNSIEFDEIRFHVPRTRTLTVANTGPISATFAFIDRPVEEEREKGPFPSWMKIEVHHESERPLQEQDDLGSSTRFTLSPGDTATIDVTLDITDQTFVRMLNSGVARIDDILVLRVLNGRDHFISIRGTWLPSSLYRNLDELVYFQDGVRSTRAGSTNLPVENQPKRTAYHSAPKEIFDLTEALPGLVERAVADWTMTNNGVLAPWDVTPSWPFSGHAWKGDEHVREMQLGKLREALDSATPVDEQFDEKLPPLARVELLTDTLVQFAQSLQDGIVPATAWQQIEAGITILEKSKGAGNQINVQDIVMEALSITPVHRVSLTFFTFMLNRLITELNIEAADTGRSPISPISRRARSSTETSEALSELSITSNETTSTISSFLPSLTRRKTGTTSAAASPTQSSAPPDKRLKLTDAYSEFWANILIRSERDTQAKGKDKRALDARKKKVLIALLDSSSM